MTTTPNTPDPMTPTPTPDLLDLTAVLTADEIRLLSESVSQILTTLETTTTPTP